MIDYSVSSNNGNNANDGRIDFVNNAAQKYVQNIWDKNLINGREYIRKLKQWYCQYRGIPNRKNVEGFANVVVNETLEATDSIVAQMFNAYTSEAKPVLIIPAEETDEKHCELVEAIMIHYLRKMSWNTKLLRSLRQSVKYGTTVAKVYWKFEEKKTLKRTETGFETIKKPVTDRPDIQYIDLLDVALEFGKAEIDDMKYLVYRKRVSYDYIAEQVRRGVYSKKQVAKINKNGKLYGDFKIGHNGFYEEENKCEILEGWCTVPRWFIDDFIDLDSEDAEESIEAIIEVYNNGVVLRRDENPYFHKKKPFLLAHYIEVDGEALGIGTCEISEFLQLELNSKRNQLLDHGRMNITPPLLRLRGSNIDKKQINLGKPFSIIDSDVPGGLTPLNIGGNVGEIVVMEERGQQNIRNITGATNPIQGIQSSKEQTAYEVSALQSKGASRINVVTIDFGEKFIKRAFYLIKELCAQYVTTETSVRIFGPKGIKWETINAEIFGGGYDCIPVIPTDLDSRTILRSQIIQFVSSIGSQYPRINIHKLVRKVYALFGFNDVDEIVPNPDTEIGQTDLTFEEEIKVLVMGQKVDAKYTDDHLQKIIALSQFLKVNIGFLSPQAALAFRDKIMQHMNYLQALGSAQNIVGAEKTPPSASNNGNSVDLQGQMYRDLSRIGG